MSEEVMEYLSFMIDDEEYGLNILDVKEVRGWSDIRKLPNSESYLLGVLELRGEYIPIIDLRQRFNMPPSVLSKTTVVVIVRNAEGQSLGIIVDAVAEVYQLSASQIKAAPGFVKIDERFIEGIASVSGNHVVLIQLERLFDFDVLHEVTQPDLVSED
ncbi:chemotaxis protein CheW [Enterovibrio norvegicus FF-33]|uniref:Chemotaxis protein CheW n=1 Tax=Enterovibrio norvegicus FF-454 TaxID=1185651 RepID=A0A1E5CF72_9GAMM|nr:chemotaxis protein CheW [Enterovibrio norvegicus]OEE64168.1 chemotaxis protein CheW [Enterovibrio norvegicus FF-454]OEE70502.1 chemotaxis protein CheW [Enterovibrio norvegicus FF-33]OEE76641.1 chemotaxis protein CheW [Enterovibrio norvegicus FF-162]